MELRKGILYPIATLAKKIKCLILRKLFLKYLFNRNSYSPEHYSIKWRARMIRIKCTNPDCTAPRGIFFFDEKATGTAGPSRQGEPNALDYAIECPFCGTLNRVWLKNPNMTKRERELSVGIRTRIVRKNPIDFK